MTQPDKLIDNRIVSMIEYNGKIMIATPSFVYDITDRENPIVMFSSEAADKAVLGKKYELVEMGNG